MSGPKRRARSYSQLSDWLSCSWAFYLKREKKVPVRPSVWLAGGSAFHAVTEAWDRAVWTGGEDHPVMPASLDWAAGTFQQEFAREIEERLEEDPNHDAAQWRVAGRKSKDKPNAEDLDWWAEKGPELVEKYIRWRCAEDNALRIVALPDGSGPAIEVEVTVPLGGIEMNGAIDRVMADELGHGQLVVIDLKSGSSDPRLKSLTQLGTYSIQAEKLYKADILWGAFYLARDGKLSGFIDLSTFTAENVGYLYQQLDDLAMEGRYLPNIENHCRTCEVAHACHWVGGIEPEGEQ